MLIDLDAILESDSSLLSYFRSLSQQDTAFTRKHFRIVATDDRQGTRFAFNFDELATDPQTLNVLANHQRNHRVFRDSRQDTADRLVAARDHIGKLIGVDATAGGKDAEDDTDESIRR